MPVSGLRTLWLLSTLAVTYVAAVVGSGFPDDGGATAMVGFILVVLSLSVLVVVHEAGHALAAVLVGYRVTGIEITPQFDGWTGWEPPAGRESIARTIVALAGGPAVTVLFGAALLLFGSFSGVLGSWRAGLGVFAVVFTLDVLAPIRRDGIPRDGLAIAEQLHGHRAWRGDFGPAVNAELEGIDAVLLKGEGERAYRYCIGEMMKRGGELPQPVWAALAARLGLASLVLGRRDLIVDAEALVIDAVAYAPHDPVVNAVDAALAARLGHERPAPSGGRRPSLREARMMRLAREVTRSVGQRRE